MQSFESVQGESLSPVQKEWKIMQSELFVHSIFPNLPKYLIKIIEADCEWPLKIIGKLKLTCHDLRRLNWKTERLLNDEIINAYMELINKRSREQANLPKVLALNTFL